MEELKEKPPILTQDEAQSYIDQHYAELMKETTRTGVYPARWHREAQRDADAAYYEPLIQQTKAEVAREIFEELAGMCCAEYSTAFRGGLHKGDELTEFKDKVIGYFISKEDLQSLNDRFLKEKK